MCVVGYHRNKEVDGGTADGVEVDGGSGAILDFGFWILDFGVARKNFRVLVGVLGCWGVGVLGRSRRRPLLPSCLGSGHYQHLGVF